MARENLKTRTARAKRIMAQLKTAYPGAHCELSYSNPLELLISTSACGWLALPLPNRPMFMGR